MPPNTDQLTLSEKPNSARPRYEGWALGLVLIFGLFHGLFYVTRVPPWGHYDEPNHFEYVWWLAFKPGHPQVDDVDPAMRRELVESLRTHGFYEAIGYEPPLDTPGAPLWIGPATQLDEPPLYYWLAALPIRALAPAGIDAQLRLARLVSLGLYLLTILFAYGAAREVTSPGNPLRVLLPFCIAALPAFTDLMTAVNNDVAAVAAFSLFVWACLRLLRRGFSPLRLAGAAAAAGICLLAKSTAYLAAPLFVLAVFMLLLLRAGRRWLWPGLSLGALLAGLAIFSWGDARGWARTTLQEKPLRVRSSAAPLGGYAFQVENPSATYPRWLDPLSQALPTAAGAGLAGQTLTLGAWIWADAPGLAQTPSLHDGFQTYNQVVAVGVEPAFFAFSARLAADATRVWVSVEPQAVSDLPTSVVYYDGLVLAAGDLADAGAPSFTDDGGDAGLWGGAPFQNLVRNGSAEAPGARIRPWLDRPGARYLPDETLPSAVLGTLLDPAGAGWYYKSAGLRLLRTFWAKFGWGQVPLLGRKPYRSLILITAAGLLGAGLALYQRRYVLRWDLLFWLAALLLGVWGIVLSRGATYIFVSNPFLPVARYAFPAIIPTMLGLTVGWWSVLALAARRGRIHPQIPSLLIVGFFLVLDLYSAISIITFYQ